MNWHKAKIEKGTYGEYTKIKEEFEEFTDALVQKDTVMALIELSDLIGAIKGYAEQKYQMTLAELLRFNKKVATFKKEHDELRNS